MGNQTDKKFTWVIKDFSALNSETIYSDDFVVGGCKWRVGAYPKGNNKAGYFSIFLSLSGSISFPTEWRRNAKFTITIVNQILEKHCRSQEVERWFDKKLANWGSRSMIPLSEVNAKDSGFLVNGELTIVANVEVLEVIGELDVLEETSTVGVHGFKLLPSQVKSVRRLFERYPKTASKLSIKNPIIKSGYMNLVLSLIETLRQSPQLITKEDMDDAYATLDFVTNAGFMLDWLEKKFDEVSERKDKEKACETRMEKLEEELNGLKHKCSDVEALIEKERAELSAVRAPLSDDDIFS